MLPAEIAAARGQGSMLGRGQRQPRRERHEQLAERVQILIQRCLRW
ncbi:MAG: hypothetical protein ACYDAG_04720 [Chloroflexota bacterium]